MPAGRRGVGVRAEVVAIAAMTAVLVVVVALTATTGLGSTAAVRDDGVTPLGRIGAGEAAAVRDDGVTPLGRIGAGEATTARPAPAPGRSGDEGPSTPKVVAATPVTAGDTAPRALDELLARYDTALTALSAAPAAAGDATGPLLVEWHRVVAEGSELDEEMRRRVLADLADRSMVVHPPPGEGSFRTLALDAVEEPDGSIRFAYCGYSPGVGVDATTGTVLDDRRASTRGDGRAEVVDGSLVLVELRDEERAQLDPGAPDPCPGLRGAARSEGGS